MLLQKKETRSRMIWATRSGEMVLGIRTTKQTRESRGCRTKKDWPKRKRKSFRVEGLSPESRESDFGQRKTWTRK
jgi:hypothetical protein